MANKYYLKRSCDECRAFKCDHESMKCTCTLGYKTDYLFATEPLPESISHRLEYYFTLKYCKPFEACPKPRTYAKNRDLYQERVKAGKIKSIKIKDVN